MVHGHTPFHIFKRGTITGVSYSDAVLDPYVRISRGAVGLDCILMGDYTRPHRAHLTEDWKVDVIHRMNWPASSPDFNPIEHCSKRKSYNNSYT